MSGEVGNFLLDLVNIEVNTIIKEGMTAEKMPEPWAAVHDVLLDYARFLAQGEADTAKRERLATLAEQPCFRRRKDFDLVEALAELGMLADVARAQREASQDLHRVALLDRILKNLVMLRELVNASEPSAKPTPKPAHKLTLKQLLLIRKMWEMGTEEIVVQTCISLDGDVVTRIDPHLLAQPSQMRDVLLGIHRESTSISIRFWSGLVEAATNLIGGLRRWGSSSSSDTGA